MVFRTGKITTIALCYWNKFQREYQVINSKRQFKKYPCVIKTLTDTALTLLKQLFLNLRHLKCIWYLWPSATSPVKMDVLPCPKSGTRLSEVPYQPRSIRCSVTRWENSSCSPGWLGFPSIACPAIYPLQVCFQTALKSFCESRPDSVSALSKSPNG